MKQVTVTVPASTANLGPGFDCLGLALGLYNEVTATAVSTPVLTLMVSGEGVGHISTDASNLVIQAAELIFQQVGERPPGLRIHQRNNIPVGSGLGSSAAAVLGGMLAANALTGNRLSRADILRLATQMEGHPDNVTPALMGGLTLIAQGEDQLHVETIDVPPLRVVIILPDFDLPTAQARAVLPQQVPLADAVFNIGRIGLLLRALSAADYATLDLAMQDRLHQPYRLPLIPSMDEAFVAARQAGAAGVALSGAGPSLIAFAPDHHEAIGAAVTAVFAQAGLTSRTWVLHVDREGSRVVNGE